MDMLASTSAGMYFLFCWLIAAFAYTSLLLFPVITFIAIVFAALIIYRDSGVTDWELLDWSIVGALIATSLIAGWLSHALFKIRPELPAGKPIEEKNFKVLIDRIHNLAETYHAPPIHHVKLTTRFEIEIQRTASNGFPSKFTNTLLIGLPVMSCMSPLHLKLLLARQIGHLASTRNSYAHRLIYLRRVWEDYANAYSAEWKASHILFRLFFSWYWKLYELTTRAAVRLDQLDKDQYMLEVSTEANAAEAIAVFGIKKHYLEHEFWPTLNKMAFTHAKPAFLPYSSMDKILGNNLDPVTAQLTYEHELNRHPNPGDVYANLRQRLLALNSEDFTIPEKRIETAASHFLGEDLLEVQKQLDKVWYLHNKSIWALRYKKGIEEKQQLKVLRKQAAQSLLSNDEARRYLLLIEKYVDSDKAIPLYMEIVETNYLDAAVCYELGRLLLSANHEAGVKALQAAMETETNYTVDCCQHIVKYMANQGDMKQAQYYRRMILAHQVEN